MVAFQELLFLCALQLLWDQEGWGLGAGKPCLSLVLTRAARDGNRTHVHQAPPSGQARAKHATHPHVVPRPSQEAAAAFLILQRRLGEEEPVPRLGKTLNLSLSTKEDHLPRSSPWPELGCFGFQEVAGEPLPVLAVWG